MNEHILVVDDEAPIRDLLSTFFRKRGYQVMTAGTAEEAQRLANEPSLNLVILDVALADEDGLELLATLKRVHPRLPVLILTGMGFDDELLKEALEKGASGYVSKTLPLEQLLMEVHRTLKQHPQAS
jgi:DNA-binding response OmpR family regulator